MAKATAIFDADDSRLSAVLAGIEKRLKRVASGMAEIGATAAKMLAAPVAALAALGVGVKSALDYGGHISDLSANTGIAVKDLMALEQEFANAGKTAEDVGPIIGKMQKNLESGAAGGVLRQLGVDMEALRQKSPLEQFHEIGKALNGIQDPAERVSALMAIFGKQGASLGAMFSSAGFGDAAAQVGSQAELLNKDAALFDDVSDKLNLVGTKVRGFFVGVADKVAPVLKPLLDKFASLDLAAYGQAIGDGFAFIIQAFSDGKLTEILSEALLISAKEFGNYMLGNFAALGAGIGQLLLEGGKMFLSLLGVLVTYDFWAGMGNALLAAGQGFVALMLDGVVALLHWLGKIPGLGKVGKWGDSVAGAAGSMHSSATESAAAAGERFSAPMEKISGQFSEAIGNIVDSMQAGQDWGSTVFDPTENQANLDKLVGEVMTSTARQQAQALKDVPTPEPPKGGWDQMLADKNAGPVSALQKIGGAFGRGGGGDPLLAHAQRQTEYQRQIAENTKPKTKSEKVEFVPGYG